MSKTKYIVQVSLFEGEIYWTQKSPSDAFDNLTDAQELADKEISHGTARVRILKVTTTEIFLHDKYQTLVHDEYSSTID